MSLTIVPGVPPPTEPGAPKWRPNLAIKWQYVAGALAVVVIAVGGYFVTHKSSSPSTAPQSPAAVAANNGPVVQQPTVSAARYVAAAMHRARGQRWVHVAVVGSVDGVPFHGRGITGRQRGQQSVTLVGHSATIRVIGRSAYIRGDAQALQDFAGFPSPMATAAAGRWVLIRPSDPGYQHDVGGVLMSSLWRTVPLHGQLRYAGTGSFVEAGHSVGYVIVQGREGHGRHEGTAFLRIESPAQLPVQLEATVPTPGGPAYQKTTTSEWGVGAHLVAPRHAIGLPALEALAQAEAQAPPGT